MDKFLENCRMFMLKETGGVFFLSLLILQMKG